MDEKVGRTIEAEKQIPPERTYPGAVRRGSRLRPIIYLAVLIALVFGAWRLYTMERPASTTRHAAPAQPVGVARVTSGDMRVVLSGLGTVTPLATVTIQTQINGQLMEVGFKEGQIVNKGDFLAQIDPRPYQVALDQAQGTLVHDQALLNQAQSDLQRYQLLGKQNSIAQQQVTDQEFLVEQDKGTVMEDQASIASAKLNLAYCHIVAPVTGRVGLRLVDPGNYVQTSSTTGLVVLTQLQPISVVFVLPEDDISDVWQELRAGQSLEVEAYDRTNTKLEGKGTLETIDNEIDTTTGTVKLRATFPNSDLALFPNQFVNARLVVKSLPHVTEAPVAAVQHGEPGAFVYVIKPNNTAAVAKVTTGVTDGDEIQIESGLSPGDLVVVDGADRLKDGAKISVTPDKDNPAATNDGPGAPPGDQPGNAAPVPAKDQADKNQTDMDQTGKDKPGRSRHQQPATQSNP